MERATEKLFTPHKLGSIQLSNRIVMAPMTRSRATDNTPNEVMAEYYTQRATAGLIITEGTAPSPHGLGYSRIPGIFSEAQVDAWEKVTSAVHAKGGKIFLQIMHTGRIGHPFNLPGKGPLLAPSAVKLETTKMWVDGEGLLEIPIAKEMTGEEVRELINDHIEAGRKAIKAGFDGIELHGANGYLIKQFLNPHINKRTDKYGGSIENRSRFLLEITSGLAKTIGSEKVGVRISPYSQYNETPAYDETEATYRYIGQQLNDLDIAYLHITDPSVEGKPNQLVKELRQLFKKSIILSGGYTAVKAEEVIKNNEADLVSFARSFIPNPDLVRRFRNKLPLSQPKFDLFYTPGREGYVDYPAFENVSVI
jgi:N-ethylmaleimide reductase